MNSVSNRGLVKASGPREQGLAGRKRSRRPTAAEPERRQSLKESRRKPIKTGADAAASLLLSTICLKLNLRIRRGSRRTRAEPMNHGEVTEQPPTPSPRSPSCPALRSGASGKPQAEGTEISFLPTKELVGANIPRPGGNVSIESDALVSPPGVQADSVVLVPSVIAAALSRGFSAPQKSVMYHSTPTAEVHR